MKETEKKSLGREIDHYLKTKANQGKPTFSINMLQKKKKEAGDVPAHVIEKILVSKTQTPHTSSQYKRQIAIAKKIDDKAEAKAESIKNEPIIMAPGVNVGMQPKAVSEIESDATKVIELVHSIAGYLPEDDRQMILGSKELLDLKMAFQK